MASPNPDYPERFQSNRALPAGAVAVCVRLQGEAPLAVIERGPWVEPPLLLFRADGTTEVMAVTCKLDAAARWILERGAGAEALSPPPLRQRVAVQAWRIYRRYRSGNVRSFPRGFSWKKN